MGRGDPRTRRGKIFRGSHGTTRPKAKNKERIAPTNAPAKAPTTEPTPTPQPQPPIEEETPVVES